ncbi:MAG: hypothetical protein ACOH1J_07855 [Microbacteriaceae bacterium]
MTNDEATAAMIEDIEDVQQIVGGERESEGGAERTCASGLAPGKQLSENRFADVDTDRANAIQLVRDYWTGLGYSVRERTDETPAIINRLFVTTASGSELEFAAYDRGMALTGLSACVPD